MPGPGTFEHVARDWLATVHEAKVSAGHAERTRILFAQDAFPWIGRRPIPEIDAPELLLAEPELWAAHRKAMSDAEATYDRVIVIAPLRSLREKRDGAV